MVSPASGSKRKEETLILLEYRNIGKRPRNNQSEIGINILLCVTIEHAAT